MNTTVSKGRDGWQAESEIPLADNYAIKLLTCKRSNRSLATTATRVQMAPDGRSYSFVMFQDFNREVIAERVKVTEKAVRLQHDAALAKLDDIKKQVQDFYCKAAA